MIGDEQPSARRGSPDGGDVRHELGNASLLLDSAIHLLIAHAETEDGSTALDKVVELLADVKRRIDKIDS